MYILSKHIIIIIIIIIIIPTVPNTPWTLHVKQYWENRKEENILFLKYEDIIKVKFVLWICVCVEHIDQ